VTTTPATALLAVPVHRTTSAAPARNPPFPGGAENRSAGSAGDGGLCGLRCAGRTAVPPSAANPPYKDASRPADAIDPRG
jgi:hypothetical protein